MPKYEIRVKGILDPIWQADFEGFELTQDRGREERPQTVLTGQVMDQSALHGVLARIRDLGLELESIRKLDSR